MGTTLFTLGYALQAYVNTLPLLIFSSFILSFGELMYVPTRQSKLADLMPEINVVPTLLLMVQFSIRKSHCIINADWRTISWFVWYSYRDYFSGIRSDYLNSLGITFNTR